MRRKSLAWVMGLLVLGFALVRIYDGQPTSGPTTAATTEPGWLEFYAADDAANPPEPNGTVFVGSSTFTFWREIPVIFEEFGAINRAFGGSTTRNQLMYMDQLVLARRPSRIVYYCGDNDLAGRKKPEVVLGNFRRFCERVHAVLPATKIYFVSIKLSERREAMADNISLTNALVRLYVRDDYDRLRFIDINQALCDSSDRPIEAFFQSDHLHLNAEGYKRITPLIRGALLIDGAPEGGFPHVTARYPATAPTTLEVLSPESAK